MGQQCKGEYLLQSVWQFVVARYAVELDTFALSGICRLFVVVISGVPVSYPKWVKTNIIDFEFALVDFGFLP